MTLALIGLTGSRSWPDRQLLEDTLLDVWHDAHQIGYTGIELMHGCAEGADTTVARHRLGNLASMPTDREEAEANRFAGGILVSEPVVRRMVAEADFDTSDQLVDLLTPRFGVTRTVMAYRLLSLGIITAA